MGEREQIIQFLLQRCDDKDKTIAQLQTAHKNASEKVADLEKKLATVEAVPVAPDAKAE